MLLLNKFMLVFDEDVAAAGAVLDEGLALNPHNTDFLFLRADYAQRVGNWVDVILAMRAYQAEKHDQSTDIYRQGLLLDYWEIGSLADEMLGAAFFNLKRYDEARDHFSIALRTNRCDARLWCDYIACCTALGDSGAVTAARYQAMDLGVAI